MQIQCKRYLSNDNRTKEKRKKKRPTKNKPQTINKIEIRAYISIITLNVNGLNAPTKTRRLAEWIKKKKKTHIYAVYKRPTSDLETHMD